MSPFPCTIRALNDRAPRRLRSLRFSHRKTASRARSHSSRDWRHQRPLRALRRPGARSRYARNHAARAPADLRSARRRVRSEFGRRHHHRDRRRAALRHHLAVVEQGHRHRARVRTRCGAPHRARHRLAHCRHEEAVACGRDASRHSLVRSHDRSRVARTQRSVAAVRQGKDPRLAHRVAGQRTRCAG